MQTVPDRIASQARRTSWTALSDQRLAQLREQGTSLRSIARVFRLSRSVITARAVQLGLEIPQRPRTDSKPVEVRVVIAREPLPAGDPLTWGLITEGTCIEGNRYTPPAPVRARRSHTASVTIVGDQG